MPFDIGIERALSAGQYSIEHLRGYDFDRMDRAALAKDGGRSPERMGSWLNMSDTRMSELAHATARVQAWNTPTLAVARFLSAPELRASIANDANYRLLAPRAQAAIAAMPLDKIFSPDAKDAMRKAYPRQRAFVKALHDAGAGLLVGTDTAVPDLVQGFTLIERDRRIRRCGHTDAERIEGGHGRRSSLPRN